MIKILFFGSLGDASPTLEVAMPSSVSTIEGLALWLSKNKGIPEKLLLKCGGAAGSGRSSGLIDEPLTGSYTQRKLNEHN